MPKRNRQIDSKGRDVLSWGDRTKDAPEHKKERLRIAQLCQEFYAYLTAEQTCPDLRLFPEHHIVTTKDNKGIAAYNRAANEILVALRLKYEAAASFKEALELCLESVAHEWFHYTNDTINQNSRDERRAERYARKAVREFLADQKA